METNERDRALVEIMLTHLTVTEKSLAIQVKTLDALRVELSFHQAFDPLHSALQELSVNTHETIERVQSILDQK